MYIILLAIFIIFLLIIGIYLSTIEHFTYDNTLPLFIEYRIPKNNVNEQSNRIFNPMPNKIY